ncbi:MAG: decaprenyl-phosphate phosphoribosyltransferase [bacterium]|nr:decaprenyl-phosphate phosphoribosyltransferase [bacterium]
MVKLLGYLFQAARPRQWLKNLAVFAAIIFTGQFFNQELFKISVLAFVIFSLLSSASYLINDLIDAPHDRLHPFKRLRPVAHGTLPKNLALGSSVLWIIGGLALSLIFIPSFFPVALVFLLTHLLYSFFLKNIAVVDILIIASAYILRVYGGEAATGFHISIWLTLCVVSLSLFLAIGKRRSELTLLAGYQGVVSSSVRKSLSHYSERLLDTYTAIFANSTWLTYAFFTFLERPAVTGWFWQSRWGAHFVFPERKWLMATIPLVIYGMMRYLQLIYEKSEGESPEKVLLSDKPLFFTVSLWALATIVIIYGFS